MDEIRLRITSSSISNCIIIMMETWLSIAVPDATIELEGHIVYGEDRTADFSKSKSGGVCIYMYTVTGAKPQTLLRNVLKILNI